MYKRYIFTVCNALKNGKMEKYSLKLRETLSMLTYHRTKLLQVQQTMTTKITLHLTKKDVAEYCIRSAYFRKSCTFLALLKDWATRQNSNIVRNGNDDISSEKHLENSKTRIFSFLFTRAVHFCPNIFILSRDPVPLKQFFPFDLTELNPEGDKGVQCFQ
jgi:hypothetical protein